MLRLTVIGRLLPMLARLALRGTSTFTAATRTTTISPVAIMCVALEQDSSLTFDFLSLHLFLGVMHSPIEQKTIVNIGK